MNAKNVFLWGFDEHDLRSWPPDLVPTPAPAWPQEGPVLVHSRALEAFQAEALMHPLPDGRLPQAILYLPAGSQPPVEAWAYFDATVHEGEWDMLRGLLACPRLFEMEEAAENLPAAFLAELARPIRQLNSAELPLPEETREHLARCVTCRHAFDRSVEARLRRLGQGLWRDAEAAPDLAGDDLAGRVRSMRGRLAASRPLLQWLLDWREELRGLGLLEGLAADEAGRQVLAVLALDDPSRLTDWPPAARRMGLAELIAWASDALEHAHFRPASPAGAKAVALPIEHLPGRDWAAVVLPGCDEAHWPPAPPLPGGLTPAQRRAVGLATVEDAQAARRTQWRLALAAAPVVDVLWRQRDAEGQAVLPSPLVQTLRLDGAGLPARDPRVRRTLTPRPEAVPAPDARGLPLPAGRLSASAYEDLRHCPYRFFAMRLLGLRRVEEIDAATDAGDWGRWVHEVLQRFHQGRQGPGDAGADRAALDAAADAATATLRPHPADFLPYRAAWPQLRDAYLRWLADHEAQGARFVQAEMEARRPLGELTLVGRIDRIDRADAASQGRHLLIDYKTESEQRVRARLKDPGEDVQLPFYCALLGDEAVDAGYLSLGTDEARLFRLDDPMAARAALIGGVLQDLQAIASGASLRPLGEGAVCETCDARGLCRKDSRS